MWSPVQSSEHLTARAKTLVDQLGGWTRKHALYYTLLRLVARDLVAAAALYLCEVAATLVTPVAIFQLLTWIDDARPDWRVGFGYLVVLGVAATLAFVADYASERFSKRAGVTSRVAVCGMLYEKIIRMSVVDAQVSNSGEMQNLFSVESAALTDLWHGMNGLILQPVEILSMVGLLFLYVREAALGGVLVIGIAFAVAHFCGTQLERLTRARAELADVRTRDTYEMLLGMKVVKMNAWEPRFAAVIREQRAKETALTRSMGRYLAVLNATSNNSVDVISLAVVLVYTLGLGNKLSPAVVFTYWVLLGLLHSRIFHFAPALKHVKDGMTSINRFHTFLARSEQQSVGESASSCTQPGIRLALRGAAFSWWPPASAVQQNNNVLQSVDVQFPQGSFTAVVGMIGSGKSTLLLSLLGETHLVGGAVLRGDVGSSTRMRIAYVPQQAWIIPGSVRDNIVFGKEFDPLRYNAVIRACALDRDIEEWRDGDQSNVAAFTLSGGQKQRISLARAAYADADVYLLDDCISALDMRVGAHVLRECVQGIMRSATRVVVTNSAAVAAAADQLMVMVPCIPAGADGQATAPRPDVPAEDHALGSIGASASSSGDVAYTAVVGTLASLRDHPDAAQILRHITSSAAGTVDDATSPAAVSRPPPAVPGLGAHGEPSHVPVPPMSPRAAKEEAAIRIAKGSAADAAPVPLGPRGMMAVRADNASGHHGPLSRVRSMAKLFSSRRVTTKRAGAVVDGTTSAPAAASTPAQSEQTADAVVPQPDSGTRRAPQLPFLLNWTHGIGGAWMVTFILTFMALEVAGVEVGVYWLSWWSEDSSERRFSFHVYMWGYIGCVLAELTGAYVRQHFYVCGVTRNTDQLHDAMLFRLTHAPMSFFDRTSIATCLQWFGRDINHLDRDAYYESEYFWTGLLYGALIMCLQIIVTPWVLLPAAVVCAMMWYMLKEAEDATASSAGITEEPQATPAASTSRMLPPASDDTRAASCACSGSKAITIASALQREHESKAPLMDHFARTLEGLTSIRAYACQTRFVAAHHAWMDAYASSQEAVQAARATQVLRGNLIGAFYYVTSVGIVVPLRATGDPSITAASAGFIVVNSCFSSAMANLIIEHRAGLMSVGHTRTRLLHHIFDTPQEASIQDNDPDIAADARIRADLNKYHRAAVARRLTAYCCAPAQREQQAAPLDAVSTPDGLTAVPPQWPAVGHLQIRDLRLRYRSDLPMVLQGISVDIPAGCRVAIVGRTGSGKSTILTAILRLVEPTSGDILIDGISIRHVPLGTLRSRVTVISQDPLFFAASLRRNLDPFNEFPDDQLLDVLKRVRLYDFASAQAAIAGQSASSATDAAARTAAPSALDMPVAEKGSNLSVGQQQCLSIARALLRDPRVLLLDEATANVDADTETLIHDTVKAAFPHATTIMIAHRLASIMDADRVLVLAAGRVVEAGHPHALLQSRGHLSTMIAAAPEEQQARMRAVAASAHASCRFV